MLTTPLPCMIGRGGVGGGDWKLTRGEDNAWEYPFPLDPHRVVPMKLVSCGDQLSTTNEEILVTLRSEKGTWRAPMLLLPRISW